jgi:NADH-ubiquinone oxidoreductase chain 4
MLMGGMPLRELLRITRSWGLFDYLSVGLVLLSVFLLVLIVLASSRIFNLGFYGVKYNSFMVVLLGSLYVSFVGRNLLLFYFSFEIRLLPTLFIILGWGYQPERLQAGIYFIIYTLMVSLPLLLMMLFLGERVIGLVT